MKSSRLSRLLVQRQSHLQLGCLRQPSPLYSIESLLRLSLCTQPLDYGALYQAKARHLLRPLSCISSIQRRFASESSSDGSSILEENMNSASGNPSSISRPPTSGRHKKIQQEDDTVVKPRKLKKRSLAKKNVSQLAATTDKQMWLSLIHI